MYPLIRSHTHPHTLTHNPPPRQALWILSLLLKRAVSNWRRRRLDRKAEVLLPRGPTRRRSTRPERTAGMVMVVVLAVVVMVVVLVVLVMVVAAAAVLVVW